MITGDILDCNHYKQILWDASYIPYNINERPDPNLLAYLFVRKINFYKSIKNRHFKYGDRSHHLIAR